VPGGVAVRLLRWSVTGIVGLRHARVWVGGQSRVLADADLWCFERPVWAGSDRSDGWGDRPSAVVGESEREESFEVDGGAAAGVEVDDEVVEGEADRND